MDGPRFFLRTCPSHHTKSHHTKRVQACVLTRTAFLPSHAPLQVDFFLQYLVILLNLLDLPGMKPVRFRIYFTGVRKTNLSTVLLNVLMSLFLAKQSSTRSTALTVHLGRPNLNELIGRSEATAVFGCGPGGLMSALRRSCAKSQLPFFQEEFQDATLGQLWGKEKKKEHFQLPV